MSHPKFFTKGNEILYGINTVYSLLKKNSGRRKIYEVLVNGQKDRDKRVLEIIDLCKKKDIKLSFLEGTQFKTFFKDQKEISQGIFASASNYNYWDIEKFLQEKKSDAVLVILDGITDVGNLGAIIRNAHAFGIDGIIIPKDRSAAVTADVARISAGALEEVKIFKVTNIAKTISLLKDRSYWIYATAVDKDKGVSLLQDTKYYFPAAIVLGSEDKGIRRLTKDVADFLITIDTKSDIDSLNVSVASGIIFHHIKSLQK